MMDDQTPEKIDLIWVEFTARKVLFEIEHIKKGDGNIETALTDCNELIELIKKAKTNAENWRTLMFHIANKIN